MSDNKFGNNQDENNLKNPEQNNWNNPYNGNNHIKSQNSANVENDLEKESQDYISLNHALNKTDIPNNQHIELRDPEHQSQKTPKKGSRLALTFVATFLAFTILAFSGFGMYSFIKNQNLFSSKKSLLDDGINPNGPTLQLNDIDQEEGALSAQTIYKNVVDSVVAIIVSDPNVGILSQEQSGVGTGIIMSKDGYIITNAHVIGNSKSNDIVVVLNNKKEYPGKVVGFDSKSDLAVVKIEETDLKPALFGNSDQVEVGSGVIAIGNPGGLEFANSITKGIISAINRPLSAPENIVKYLQTDTAINPGNSGGPLFNMQGQVIGITSSKFAAAGFEGMGFAIPINTAKTIIDDIVKTGYVSGRARLGIGFDVVSAYQAQRYNVPQGIVVKKIEPESDFTSKGVKVGDIITKIEGTNISDAKTIINEVSKHKVGDTLKLTVYRMATRTSPQDTFEVTVKLIEDKGQTE